MVWDSACMMKLTCLIEFVDTIWYIRNMYTCTWWSFIICIQPEVNIHFNALLFSAQKAAITLWELGVEGYLISTAYWCFLFLHRTCCGYPLEAPWRGISTSYPQHIYGENYPRIIIKSSVIPDQTPFRPQLDTSFFPTVWIWHVLIYAYSSNDIVHVQYD